MFDGRPLSALAVACLLLGVAAVGGVDSGAYLADDAAAGGNVAGGVLDVKLAETGPATQDGTVDESRADALRRTWADYDHAALGGDSATNAIALNTTGDVAVTTVNLTFSYAENDSGSGDGNPTKTARTMEVANATYGGTDLTASVIADENGNGRLDVEDLTLGSTAENLSTLSGFGAGENVSFELTVSGDADLLSGVDTGDGIDIGLTVRGETSSYADRDESVNNTIRYA